MSALPTPPLTPRMLLSAYAQGYFPMGDPESGEIHWYSPDPRGHLPLDSFHVPDSLRKRVRSGVFEIRLDTEFEEVMRQCARPRRGQPETWINEEIIRAYVDAHRRGFAHSVEAWRQGRLVGGLYGMSIHAAFFGESMFSRPDLGGTDASKVCLVALVDRQGARLLAPRHAVRQRASCAVRVRSDLARDIPHAPRRRAAPDRSLMEINGTGTFYVLVK